MSAGKKHTVYLNAEQEAHLNDSGLKLSDVIERGLRATPVSEDGRMPEDLRRTMEFVNRVTGVLLDGGTIRTRYASGDEEAVQAPLG